MNTLPANYDVWRLTPEDERDNYAEQKTGENPYLDFEVETMPLLPSWSVDESE